MDILGLGACAVFIAAFASLLKKQNREYALLLAVCAVVLILLDTLGQLEPYLTRIEELSGIQGGEYLSVMLKAAGITVSGQIASSLCKDAGENSIAYGVEIASKTAVLLAAFPVISKIFELLSKAMGI